MLILHIQLFDDNINYSTKLHRLIHLTFLQFLAMDFFMLQEPAKVKKAWEGCRVEQTRHLGCKMASNHCQSLAARRVDQPFL